MTKHVQGKCNLWPRNSIIRSLIIIIIINAFIFLFCDLCPCQNIMVTMGSTGLPHAQQCLFYILISIMNLVNHEWFEINFLHFLFYLFNRSRVYMKITCTNACEIHVCISNLKGNLKLKLKFWISNLETQAKCKLWAFNPYKIKTAK